MINKILIAMEKNKKTPLYIAITGFLISVLSLIIAINAYI